MMHSEKIKSNISFWNKETETKDYDVMIDGKNIFDQPAKNDQRTYDNIQKV